MVKVLIFFLLLGIFGGKPAVGFYIYWGARFTKLFFLSLTIFVYFSIIKEFFIYSNHFKSAASEILDAKIDYNRYRLIEVDEEGYEFFTCFSSLVEYISTTEDYVNSNSLIFSFNSFNALPPGKKIKQSFSENNHFVREMGSAAKEVCLATVFSETEYLQGSNYLEWFDRYLFWVDSFKKDFNGDFSWKNYNIYYIDWKPSMDIEKEFHNLPVEGDYLWENNFCYGYVDHFSFLGSVYNYNLSTIRFDSIMYLNDSDEIDFEIHPNQAIAIMRELRVDTLDKTFWF